MAQELLELREKLVEECMEKRGLKNQAVLNAIRSVPREEFVPPELVRFAYEDSALPIGEGQTISQPYIVALMAEALELKSTDRVLEVGGGCGYAAAVLSLLAREIYSIECHEELVMGARKRLKRLGYGNVQVIHGDGSKGWPEAAPFDAISVAAGARTVPRPLLDQLAVGGRLVIPAGETATHQQLLQILRIDQENYRTKVLGEVRFVPLIGEAGWEKEDGRIHLAPSLPPEKTIADHVSDGCEPFSTIEEADLEPLMARIGDSRLVLIGEASHGTAQFYDMRARITRELIEKKGFQIVAVEADWPDAAAVDRYARRIPPDASGATEFFTRFPTWMWANRSVLSFVEWLRAYNSRFEEPSEGVGFYGLDLYSMYGSIDTVLNYLSQIDPESAETARQRYGCLSHWADDPARYGVAAMKSRGRQCEDEVIGVIKAMLEKQTEYEVADGHRFFDAAENARLVADAERYYRTMYHGSRHSWNLRDRHMFETLERILEFRGSDSKAVVWEHNSHLGDARATEMGARGELNVGQLTREKFGPSAYLIGFGTDRGTVAAASDWGGEMEVKTVRPSHPDSYERICWDAEPGCFFLPLRYPSSGIIRAELHPERLERAIGVIYRPESERMSHYFYACLPNQFDEWIWFDETDAVEPLPRRVEIQKSRASADDTFPFGL